MTERVVGITIAFAVLLVLFRLLELTRPRARRMPVLRPGFWTDVVYWFFQPLIARAVVGIAVAVTLGPIAWMIYGRLDKATLLDGFGPASQFPLWVQAIAILVTSDFVGYWVHRAFHRTQLWSFHAIHHSSTHLDWLAAVRSHPVNEAVGRIATTFPLLVLGLAPKAVIAIVPFITFMAIVVHANVDWDWGRLRYVLASPRFHRWHHTVETEGGNRNFAALFPVWDLMFGTWYMPRDRVPERFGTDTPVPAGFLGQLVFPFRKRTG